PAKSAACRNLSLKSALPLLAPPSRHRKACSLVATKGRLRATSRRFLLCRQMLRNPREFEPHLLQFVPPLTESTFDLSPPSLLLRERPADPPRHPLLLRPV